MLLWLLCLLAAPGSLQEPNFYTSRCNDNALTCSLHEQQKYINNVRGLGWAGMACQAPPLPLPGLSRPELLSPGLLML